MDTDSTPDADPTNDVTVDGVVDGAGGDEDDSDPAVVRVREVDLAIDKQASVSTTAAGTEFDWNLVVVNNGPDPEIATITVTDELPAEVELVSVEGVGWTCTSDTDDDGVSSIECEYDGGLAVGASAPPIVITNTAIDDIDADATVTNTASVSSATPDANPDNNDDDDTVNVTFTPPPPEPPVTAPPVDPPVQIPATGSNIDSMLLTGFGFLLTGMLLVIARRSRRRPRVIVVR